MNGVDQLVNSCPAVLFRDFSEMGIAGGCFRSGMAEKGLDVTKA
jgi:hypothetical protein